MKYETHVAKTTRRTKTSSRQTDNIEVLSERLGFLQIINKALEETYKQSDKEISVAPVPATTNRLLCLRT